MKGLTKEINIRDGRIQYKGIYTFDLDKYNEKEKKMTATIDHWKLDV